MENSTAYKMFGKPDPARRAVAFVVDGIIAGILWLLFHDIGVILGALYLLVRDGISLSFMDRRSLGKKLTGLRPIRLDQGQMDLETSIKRNWIFALLILIVVFRVIPLIGWLIAALLAIVFLVLVIMEIVFILHDPEGRRWGDHLANTKVVELEKP
jgi:uncharacterized RDD family membrane protein YckC